MSEQQVQTQPGEEATCGATPNNSVEAVCTCVTVTVTRSPRSLSQLGEALRCSTQTFLVSPTVLSLQLSSSKEAPQTTRSAREAWGPCSGLPVPVQGGSCCFQFRRSRRVRPPSQPQLCQGQGLACRPPRPTLSQSEDLGLKPVSQRSLRRRQGGRSRRSLLVQSPPLDTGASTNSSYRRVVTCGWTALLCC